MFVEFPAQPPAANTVEMVQVRPARLPRSASEAAFSVVRLDQEEVDGSQRLDQALAQAPGLSLFRRNSSLAANPTTQGMSLRSIAPSGAGRALVTLDGVPQNDPFGGWVIWASLPSEIVEGVSIVRGGGAGPYGAGALTGVVSIDERAREGYAASARFGELGTERGAFVIENNIGAADLMFAVSGGRSDGFIPVRAGRGPADTKLSVEDWNVALRGNFEVGEAVLSARVGAYEESRGSGLALANARVSGESASLTLARSPANGALGFRVQGWARTTDLYNTSVSINGGAARTSTTPSNNQYETPATGYGLNAAVRGASENREWEVGADTRSSTGETHEQFSANGLGGFLNNRVAGGDAFIGGLYAEGTQKSGDWLFTGGARVDYWSTTNAVRVETVILTGLPSVPAPPAPGVDRDGTVPSLRFGARRNFGDSFVRGAAYSSFRPPSLNELHRPFRVGIVSTLANSALTPEKLWGAEIGAGYANAQGSVSATVFHNVLDDAITNVTIGVNTLQRQNAGTVTATGVELEAERVFSDQFRGRAAVAWTDAKTQTNLRPPQAPETTATAGLAWSPVSRLSLEIQARYESDRFEDDLNTVRLPAATVADIRAEWTLNDRAKIYVAADNVFDEAVATGQTSGVVSYGAPRVVSFGVTVRR